MRKEEYLAYTKVGWLDGRWYIACLGAIKGLGKKLWAARFGPAEPETCCVVLELGAARPNTRELTEYKKMI